MATSKENTLQIKNMRGVDRFVEGTQSEPDVLYQLQNMFVPNPGEMKAISGVTKLNATALTGVNKILHAKFLDTKNEKDLCILYEPTTTLPSAPSSYTFASSANTITMTIAAPAVVTLAAHGFVADTAIVFNTTGALPTGVTAGTTYYVIAAGLTANTFEFSTTVGGAAVNTSGTQSGVHRIGLSRDIYIEYITPGGGRTATKYTGQPIAQDAGVVVTIPSITDPLILSANIWITDNQGTITWSGGFYKKSNGTWPSSITVYAPSGLSGSTSTDQVGFSYPSSAPSFTAVYDASASLVSDRTYFLGIGAWIGLPAWNATTEVAFNSSTLNGLTMSCYVPAGKNKINFTFDFCPEGVTYLGTVPVSTAIFPKRALVYMGSTPEDLMPIGVSDGTAAPVLITKVSYAADTADVTLGSAGPPIVPGTITVGGGYNIPVGSLIRYVAGVGQIQVGGVGITSGAYYYVKASTATASGCVIQISNTASTAALIFSGVVAGAYEWRWATVSGSVLSLPKNLEVISSCGSRNTTNNAVYPVAISGRASGYANLRWRNLFDFKTEPSTSTTTPFQIGCMVFTSLDMSSRRDVLQSPFQIAPNLSNYVNAIIGSYLQTVGYSFPFSIPVKDSLNNTIVWSFESRQYGNRLWMVNGFNEPFYTNGYVLKSGIPSASSGDVFARWPITNFIEFYKDRMALASGGSNLSSQASGNVTYQPGWFYYSQVKTGSSDIQNFCYSSTTPNAISVSTGDQSEIIGLNVYSQDLTTVGAESFLVVGKEQVVMTWDGDLTHPAKQISKATGFAGPSAYALTKFGPVFVGSDNVYLFRTSQDVVPIGDSVKDIIKGLTKVQLRKISVVYHDEDIKIGYPTDLNIDSELWLRLRYENGGVQKAWSGPHRMKEYQGQATILNFDSSINVRVSFLDTDLYRRDDPGSFLNDTQDITRVLKIINLGLQQDHLLKLITRVYMALRTVQDEDFNLTLQSQDGSQSIVVSTTAQSSGNQRQLKQIFIPQRFLARVLSLTIENTSDSDLSIYDLSILYETLRRRTIP